MFPRPRRSRRPYSRIPEDHDRSADDSRFFLHRFRMACTTRSFGAKRARSSVFLNLLSVVLKADTGQLPSGHHTLLVEYAFMAASVAFVAARFLACVQAVPRKSQAAHEARDFLASPAQFPHAQVLRGRNLRRTSSSIASRTSAPR